MLIGSLIFSYTRRSKFENTKVKCLIYVVACVDPIYVAYHDEEWGVPVHDDK